MKVHAGHLPDRASVAELRGVEHRPRVRTCAQQRGDELALRAQGVLLEAQITELGLDLLLGHGVYLGILDVHGGNDNIKSENYP